jgi:tetratricopeptide (TPR) repeat protein
MSMTADPAAHSGLGAWQRAQTPGDLRQLLARLPWGARAAAIEEIAAQAAAAQAEGRPAQAALLRYIGQAAQEVQREAQPPAGDETDVLLAQAWQVAPAALDVYLLLRRHPTAITTQTLARARELFIRPGAPQHDADRALCVLAVIGLMLRDPGQAAQAHLLWQGILQHDENLAGAARHLARARALADATGDAGTAADADLALARLRERAGDLAGAVEAYERAMETSGQAASSLPWLPVLERLADAYRQLGRPADALARIDQAIPMLRELGDQGKLVDALNFRALLLEDGGDYLAGGEAFEEAAAAARAAGIFPAEFKAATNAAMSRLKRQRWNEAVDRYQNVLGRARASGQQNLIAAAQNNLGQALLAAGRPADAARQFGPALMYGIGSQDPGRAGHAALGLASAYAKLGNGGAAKDMHSMAAMFVLQSGDEGLYGMWVTSLPQYEPDPAASAEALRGAVSAARESGSLRRELTLTLAYIGALERTGAMAQAEEAAARAVEAARAADPRSPWLLLYIRELAGLLSKDPGRAEQAYRLVEEGMELVGQRMDAAASDLARSEIIADQAGLLGLKIDLLCRHGTGLAAAGLLPGGSRPDTAAFEAHQVAKSPFLVSLLARSRPGHATAAGGERVRPASAAELAGVLERADPSAALVSFFTDDRQTVCFVVRAGDPQPSVTIVDLGRREAESVVGQLRRAFNGSPGEFPPYPPIRGDRPWSRPLSALDGISGRLLSFLPQVEGAEVICLAPHGPLHLLPWAALRAPGGHYLVEQHGVAVTPAATMLRYLRQDQPPGQQRPPRALVAGVAAAQDRHPEFFENDGDLLSSAVWEVENRPGLLAGKHSTQAAFAGRDLVHLTCHGFFNSSRPLDSGLVLSDGYERPPRDPHGLPVSRRRDFVLTAGELLSQSLTADLAVLRACVSGVQAVQNAADETQGLATSLLSAGAASLLVSLWNVDQRSSRELLRLFYRHWLPGQAASRKWRALADAQRWFISGQDEARRHPYHWAPLSLVGDWR